MCVKKRFAFADWDGLISPILRLNAGGLRNEDRGDFTCLLTSSCTGRSHKDCIRGHGHTPAEVTIGRYRALQNLDLSPTGGGAHKREEDDLPHLLARTCGAKGHMMKLQIRTGKSISPIVVP